MSNRWFSFLFSCTVNKGFGGTLVDVKDKILKEGKDFYLWKRNILDKDDGQETLNTEEVDQQGEHILLFSVRLRVDLEINEPVSSPLFDVHLILRAS